VKWRETRLVSENSKLSGRNTASISRQPALLKEGATLLFMARLRVCRACASCYRVLAVPCAWRCWRGLNMRGLRLLSWRFAGVCMALRWHRRGISAPYNGMVWRKMAGGAGAGGIRRLYPFLPVRPPSIALWRLTWNA